VFVKYLLERGYGVTGSEQKRCIWLAKFLSLLRIGLQGLQKRPSVKVFCSPCGRGRAGRPCPPSPPIKVCLMSPPSPREKEATAQATPKRRWLRRVWEKSEFVTRGPSKLAKQPNNHETVAHIINPGEITRFVHATDLAWQHSYSSNSQLSAIEDIAANEWFIIQLNGDIQQKAHWTSLRSGTERTINRGGARVTRVTRMAYSPRLWLMAIGWWNKINQCKKLKLNLTQTWEVCMSLDSGMH
jgi:hypothetical protein